MIKEIYRSATFNPLKHLSEKYKHRQQGDLQHFNKETAKTIAHEVQEWAKSKGVTSFTFWIHPQTNQTIEKHDSIYDLEYLFKEYQNFDISQKFTSTALMKGEGDGSSFPSGGIRTTDKARAYFVWQTKSDMFIRQTKNGKVLYIPGLLLTHHGEALDEKTYLLRAQKQLKQSTIRLMKLLGHDETKHVMLALGIQQQFFIIPKKDFESRIDFKQCGRSLYGKLPPRNQQFSDHYYAKIDDSILQIMNQAESELLKIGVPVKTKHKEVAVNQYQIACCYENAAASIDHNMMLMDILKSTFDKHGYTVLFHEKPFAHANGSGKHCNWSIMVNNNQQMKNLFEPGPNPKSNKQFLLFLLITLKAVLQNSELIKASVTSPSNEHRMGGHQAPPSIISVFLGSYIDSLLNSIQKGEQFVNQIKDLKDSIPGMYSFLQDNTDRNRTSPFAFTGNKFQFRAVGSKQNASFPMTVIASIMAKGIKEVSEELEKGVDVDTIIHQLIKDTKNIRFQGDGYSKSWEKEASIRGLPNLKSALKSFEAVYNSDVLIETGVFSDVQLKAKYNILMNNYVDTKLTDAETMEIIIRQNFLPRLLDQLKKFTDLGKDSVVYKLEVPKYQKIYTQLFSFSNKLRETVSQINGIEELEGKVAKAQKLREFLDVLGYELSGIELQLPITKQFPQLHQILSMYH